MSLPGYVQVAPDSTGKKIANTPITLPAGTVVLNDDGTKTTLAAATVVYIQNVHLVDEDGKPIPIQDLGSGQTVALLEEILSTLRQMPFQLSLQK